MDELQPILWLALSFFLYALATNVAWTYRGLRLGRIGWLVETNKRWPQRAWFPQPLRLLYYLGLPYLALLKGVVNPRSMGLVDLDWFQHLGRGAVLGGGAFIFLSLVWGYYARSTRQLRSVADPLFSRLATLNQPWGWALLLLDVVYLQAHWAFYRSLPTQLLGDLYGGVFLGLILILLEGTSNPLLRHDLGQLERAGGILLTGAMALVTALVYLFTRNLWLCVLVHLGIEVGLLRLWGTLRRGTGIEKGSEVG
jgi:hypothetical protein